MTEVLLPAQLTARLRDAPGLAWTTANAYAPAMTPPVGPFGRAVLLLNGAWVAPRLIYWMPLLVVALQTGGLARLNRHALVLVNPDAPVTPGTVFKLFLSVVIPAGVLFPVLYALPITAAQIQVAAGLLGALILLDVVAVARQRRRHGSTGPRRKELEKAGMPVLDVGLYAAHPRGRKHGGQLLRALLPHVPPTTTLLATAASESLAQMYIERYQFTRYDPEHPLLLERRPLTRHREPTG